MDMERRRFLQGLAAATFCFGFDSLARGAETEPAEALHALKAALAEMRATRSPGIGIVLPVDREQRETLRAHLQLVHDRMRRWACADYTWLVEAVFVVAPGRTLGALPGETLVLLETDGRRAAGSTEVLDDETLPRQSKALVRLDGRLERRVQAARSPRVQRALADLLSKDAQTMVAAHHWLVKHFATAGPAVIEANEGDVFHIEIVRVLCAVVLARANAGATPSGADPSQLPFGMTWIPRARPDPCPTCGMMTSPRGRDLLQFLGDEAPESR